MQKMQSIAKMKFSVRLALIVGTLVAVVVVFFFLQKPIMKNGVSYNKFGNDGQWPEFKSSGAKDSLSSEQKWESVFDSSKRVYALDNVSMCEFTKKSSATVDIDTHKLLHTIDQAYQQHWDKTESRDLQEYFDLPNIMNVNLKHELKDRPLQVIAIPHSHNDAGWLKTLNRYYTEQTKQILDFMLVKLVQYPNMTFVWSETVFLQRWWDELDSLSQDKVKALIKNNRLEIVNGGWIVPDEATTHYFGILEQLIEGHQWLEQNLGVRPKNSWSLDVFGYSSSIAYMLKQAGYDHMVILRINKFLKEYLQGRNILEFNWRQAWDTSNSTDIFTSVLPYKLYNIKYQCGPDEMACRYFDFRNIPGEFAEVAPLEITNQNVVVHARQLLEQYVLKNKLYTHNVVMIPIGDDFRYDREVEWDQQYLNYNRLFEYMNKNWNVNARFGTVQDYFTAVKEEIGLIGSKKLPLPSLKGDFFPYTDRDEQYWTGYYTTRPFDKSMGRELEVNLRAAEILNVLALFVRNEAHGYKSFESNIENLTLARRNLGLFQHHDAITGTARAHVVLDYEHRLHNSFQAVKRVMEEATLYLVTRNEGMTSLEIEREQPKTMYLLNPSKTVMDFSLKKKHTIVLFNPLAQEREDVIRVTVNEAFVDVYNSHGEAVLSQLNPIWKTQTEVSDKEFMVVFLARIPALGIVKYSIVSVEGAKPKENVAAFLSVSNFKKGVIIPPKSRFVSATPRGETYVLENDFLRARFSARSGYIKSLTTKAKLGTTQVHAELLMYKSRTSGAYIFNPTGPAVDTEMFNLSPIKVIKGPIVSEIELMQRDDVCQHTVRVYNSTGLLGTALEINNIANMEFKEDKELVLRFKTDIQHTNGTFYTDLNGLQTTKRQSFRNFPKAANFYPMTTHAFLEDDNTRLSILSSQSLGVSSQEQGSLEVMLERNPLYDDGRGMGEGIRDGKRTLSQFFLLIERQDNAANAEKRVDAQTDVVFPSLQAHLLQRHLQHSTIIFHLKNDSQSKFDSFSPVLNPLPCDTHLVNFRSMISKESGKNAASFPSPILSLHKMGYQCNFPLLGIKCDVQNNDIVLNKLLTATTFKVVEEMSLSLMYSLRKCNPDEKLNLSPMDLYMYRVTQAI